MKKMMTIALSVAITALGALGILYFTKLHISKAPLPRIMVELDATACNREQELTAIYVSHRIPQPLAALTAKIDRIENDLVELTNALTATPPPSEAEQKILRTAVKAKENESGATLDTHRSLLDKYAEKARRNKDPEVARLVQVLKSRSFLFERRT